MSHHLETITPKEKPVGGDSKDKSYNQTYEQW